MPHLYSISKQLSLKIQASAEGEFEQISTRKSCTCMYTVCVVVVVTCVRVCECQYVYAEHGVIPYTEHQS